MPFSPQCNVEKVLAAQSCPTLCDPMDCSPPDSSVHGNSLGKNTGVGCHSLLQGILPTQGSNPGLLQCRQMLYHLSHQRMQHNHAIINVRTVIVLTFNVRTVLSFNVMSYLIQLKSHSSNTESEDTVY